VFESSPGAKPKRSIVLLGNAGMGKSTLIKKLCVDWSDGLLPQFDFVFLLDGKALTLPPEPTYSLRSLLLHLSCPHPRDVFSQVLSVPERVLVIFDGFEVVRDLEGLLQSPADDSEGENYSVRQLFSGLLQRKLLPGCSLLLSARPRGTVSGLLRRADSLLELSGFSPPDIERYLGQYFSGQSLEAPTSVLDSIPVPTSVLAPAPVPVPTSVLAPVSVPVPFPVSVSVSVPVSVSVSVPVPVPASVPTSASVPVPTSVPDSVPVPASASASVLVPVPTSVPVPVPVPVPVLALTRLHSQPYLLSVCWNPALCHMVCLLLEHWDVSEPLPSTLTGLCYRVLLLKMRRHTRKCTRCQTLPQTPTQAHTHTLKHSQKHTLKHTHGQTLPQTPTQAHTHTLKHSQKHVLKQTHCQTLPQTQTQAHTHTHSQKHTLKHTHCQTLPQTQTQAHTHTLKHSQKHTRKHTRNWTRTHIRTRSHTQSQIQLEDEKRRIETREEEERERGEKREEEEREREDGEKEREEKREEEEREREEGEEEREEKREEEEREREEGEEEREREEGEEEREEKREEEEREREEGEEEREREEGEKEREEMREEEEREREEGEEESEREEEGEEEREREEGEEEREREEEEREREEGEEEREEENMCVLSELSGLAWQGVKGHSSLLTLTLDNTVCVKLRLFGLRTGLVHSHWLRGEQGRDGGGGGVSSDKILSWAHPFLQSFLGGAHLSVSSCVSDRALLAQILPQPRGRRRPQGECLDLAQRFAVGLLFRNNVELRDLATLDTGAMKVVAAKRAAVISHLENLHHGDLSPARLLEACHCVYETGDVRLVRHLVRNLPEVLSFQGIPLCPADAFVVWKLLDQCRTLRRRFCLGLEDTGLRMTGLKLLTGLNNIHSYRACIADTITLWEELEQSGEEELLKATVSKLTLNPFRATQVSHVQHLSTLVNIHTGRRLSESQSDGVLGEGLPAVRDLHKLEFELGPVNGPLAFPKLLELLPALHSLHHLDLENSKLGDSGAEGLAGAVLSLSSLQIINLSQNCIGDQGIGSLAPALSTLPSLHCLSLYSNVISDGGAESLAAVLPQMTSLSDLDVKYNSFTALGAQSLTSSLRDCPWIKSLGMWNVCIPYGVLERLQQQDPRIQLL
ncbi:MHC class II transactivator-like, partial [Oncorhynchus nerka]|uniref:MHC class II transactivator-like n=1 Tax=Oncorhynchus nerka TaxID=8023 RepID=UPI0031B7FF5E